MNNPDIVKDLPVLSTVYGDQPTDSLLEMFNNTRLILVISAEVDNAFNCKQVDGDVTPDRVANHLNLFFGRHDQISTMTARVIGDAVMITDKHGEDLVKLSVTANAG